MTTGGDEAKRSKGRAEEIFCTGKVAFDSRELAVKTSHNRARSKGGKSERDAYKCVACRKWHLGTGRSRTNNLKHAALQRKRRASEQEL